MARIRPTGQAVPQRSPESPSVSRPWLIRERAPVLPTASPPAPSPGQGFAECAAGEIPPKVFPPRATRLGKPLGAEQRILLGCLPWGRGEAGTTYKVRGVWARLCSVRYWVASRCTTQAAPFLCMAALLSLGPSHTWADL